MRDPKRAQENCCLLTNGLGGYVSVSMAGSVTRGNQGILISARPAPGMRYNLVHRLRESVVMGKKEFFFSTQDMVQEDGAVVLQEDGYRFLSSFVYETLGEWNYEVEGLAVRKILAMMPEDNTTLVRYEVENISGEEVSLRVEPGFLCTVKGSSRREKIPFRWDGEMLTCEDCRVWVKTNGNMVEVPEAWDHLYYRDDVGDGRTPNSLSFRCLRAEAKVASGEKKTLEMLFSDTPIRHRGADILSAVETYRKELEDKIIFRNPVARQLVLSSDAYISRRDSTGGKTVLAGYPFFADWGRDTMIALPGCVLAANRIQTAKSILETFLTYEKDGLIPNLFPEGEEEPRYNTVDAALLLIHVIWLYYDKTQDREFLHRAYPVLQRIVESYRHGTHHGIHMDEDGLIAAGEGLDQVTWMDVCVNGFLPTPRHGKPVEINAYWYNALRIMEVLASVLGRDGEMYGELAQRTRTSFLEKFWMEERGYLRDVISGTESDEQLRCNQIWAVTMPFSMLNKDQESRVVETVYRELYTPCGLRTLSPSDPQFHPYYGGPQEERDLAYHQGTTWVFPLGAFYRAWLKVHDYSEEAVSWVERRLEAVIPMLREGCVGQLPEIYDGCLPGNSKGCFAQAWSVGEILSVYEQLEEIREAAV